MSDHKVEYQHRDIVDPEKLGSPPTSDVSYTITRKPVGADVKLPRSTTTLTNSNIGPPTSQPSRRRPLIARLKTEYTLLSRRRKIILLGALVALLVLIIGLAAGLASRGRSSKGASNLPLPNNHGGPYTGDLTYYDPGLGACGITSSSKDNIVAVSHIIFDAVSTGSNPNANPLCGKKIRARREGKSMDVTVVDRCVGCKATDLDVTQSVFEQLANVDQGRVLVDWAWLEDVPGADIPSMSTSMPVTTTILATGNGTMSVTQMLTETSTSLDESVTNTVEEGATSSSNDVRPTDTSSTTSSASRSLRTSTPTSPRSASNSAPSTTEGGLLTRTSALLTRTPQPIIG